MRNPQSSYARAENLVVSLANLAALALLAFVLAYWTWAWLAPRAEPAPRAVVETPRIENAYALFGDAQAAASAGAAYTLLGVAASSGSRPGHAVLRVDGARTAVVREGDEIAPAVRLVEVRGDRVVIDENGNRRSLEWPKAVRASPAAQVNKP